MVVADGRDPPLRQADVVVLDAPCLGTGGGPLHSLLVGPCAADETLAGLAEYGFYVSAGTEAGPLDFSAAEPARFEFDDPNFNFRSLRGNAVLRWEYRPGSTLFVVWTQARSNDLEQDPFAIDAPYLYDTTTGRQLADAFDLYPANLLIVKLTYTLLR